MMKIVCNDILIIKPATSTIQMMNTSRHEPRSNISYAVMSIKIEVGISKQSTTHRNYCFLINLEEKTIMFIYNNYYLLVAYLSLQE